MNVVERAVSRNPSRNIWRNRPIMVLWACLVLESFALWGANGPLFVTLAVQWSGGPLAAGVVFALSVAPHIILGPVAGSLLDHVCRRNALLVTNLARGAVVLALLLCVGSTTGLYLATLALATSQLVALVARGTLVQALVEREQLQAANGALNSASAIGRIVGPSILGAVLDRFGASAAYLVVAVPFFVVTLMLLAVPRVRIMPSSARILERTLDGVRHSFTTPLPRMIIVSTFVFLIGGATLNVLELLLATDVLRAGATGFGLMLSLYCCGGLVGGLASTRVRGSRSFASYVVNALLMGAFTLALFAARSLPMALALLTCAGMAEAARQVASSSLFQAWTSRDKLARVLGTHAAASAAGMAAAYLTAPAVARLLGVRPSLVLAGAIIMASALVAVALGRRLPASRGLRPQVLPRDDSA